MENQYLKEHAFANQVYHLIPVGKNHSISMNNLASLLDIDPRDIRQIVQELRMNGLIICSCQMGYFLPSDDIMDVLKFYKYYQQRAKTNLRSLRATRAYLRSYGLLDEE